MIERFMVHTVKVRTYSGEGSMGPIYAPEATMERVYVDETTRLVRAADGSEVTSSTTIYDAGLARADMLKVGTLVTLPSGDTTTVLSRSVHSMPLPGMPEHVEAACE